MFVWSKRMMVRLGCNNQHGKTANSRHHEQKRNSFKDKGRLINEKLFVLALNGGNAAYTSFPEKIKRHQVHHGVLDVVDLLFKRQLWREQTELFLKHINNVLKGLIFGWLKQKSHYVRPLRYCLDVSSSQSLPGLRLHLSQWEENNVHSVDNKTKGMWTMIIPLAFFNWGKKKKKRNLPSQSSPFYVKTDSVHYFTAL